MYANSWTWQNVWSGLWHSNCFNALQVWECQEISWLKTRVTGSSEALHRKGWCISNWKDSQSGRSSLSSAPWRGRCQKTRSGGPGAWVRKTIIGFIIIVFVLVSNITRWSLFYSYLDFCMDHLSWQWRPHIAGCKMFLTLLRAELAVWTHFFAKCISGICEDAKTPKIGCFFHIPGWSIRIFGNITF